MGGNETRVTGWPAHRVTGVDVWPFRIRAERAELLLLHRVATDEPPFWQGVSGWIEPDEAPHLTALRELREETGLEAEALFSVDAIFDLYKPRRGTVETIVPFAIRLAGDADPILSEEHNEWRWASIPDALGLLPYEPQRVAVRRIAEDLLDLTSSAIFHRIDLPSRRASDR